MPPFSPPQRGMNKLQGETVSYRCIQRTSIFLASVTSKVPKGLGLGIETGYAVKRGPLVHHFTRENGAHAAHLDSLSGNVF